MVIPGEYCNFEITTYINKHKILSSIIKLKRVFFFLAWLVLLSCIARRVALWYCIEQNLLRIGSVASKKMACTYKTLKKLGVLNKI